MSESEAINRMFRAFSDPLRLRILHLLQQGEICVGDLVELLQVPQPTASRHLRYLRDAELVEFRREGRWLYYSLAKATSGFHGRLLDCLGSCFDEVPDLVADARALVTLRKNGGCCAGA
jgi:ArsR family transcriptional regulator, arsenate/arsenite/antimonite-responsive transcriptional repressor